MQIKNSGEAVKLLLIQGGLLILITVMLLVFDTTVALSGFLGGTLAFSTSLLMYLIIFGRYRAQQPGRILAKFYSAELVKLIITVAAFALIVLNVKPLSCAALILVYFFIQVIPAVLINYR